MTKEKIVFQSKLSSSIFVIFPVLFAVIIILIIILLNSIPESVFNKYFSKSSNSLIYLGFIVFFTILIALFIAKIYSRFIIYETSIQLKGLFPKPDSLNISIKDVEEFKRKFPSTLLVRTTSGKTAQFGMVADVRHFVNIGNEYRNKIKE